MHSVCIKQNYNHLKIAESLLFGDERNATKWAKRKITIVYEDRLHGLWFVLLYSRLKFQNVLLFFKDIDMVELGVTGCSEDQMQEESYFIRPSQHQENK